MDLFNRIRRTPVGEPASLDAMNTEDRNMTFYAKYFSRKATPQSQPIPDRNQVENSAGGYVFALDDWARLDRFLILGCEGSTYYATERALTIENALAVTRCLDADGPRTVARIVEISRAGRAPKQNPAIFALALAASW